MNTLNLTLNDWLADSVDTLLALDLIDPDPAVEALPEFDKPRDVYDVITENVQ